MTLSLTLTAAFAAGFALGTWTAGARIGHVARAAASGAEIPPAFVPLAETFAGGFARRNAALAVAAREDRGEP